MAAWISSRVGCGIRASSAVAVTICPGVQKPHCRASSATNACWSGVGPSRDRPSIVVTACPSAAAASMRHECDRATVEQDGAGAARPLAARDLRPGQPEVVAQHVHEPPCGGDLELISLPIDVERDPHARRTTREQSCSRCS